MSDTPAKPISTDKGGDKETLVSIVKEMTESMTGAQSTRHWADDALWFDIPPFATEKNKVSVWRVVMLFVETAENPVKKLQCWLNTPRCNGTMRNLNCLVPANTPFNFLLVAFSVNDAGEIVGFGVTADGVHAFLAMPSRLDEGAPTLCSPTTGNISSDAADDARMPKLILTPELRRQLDEQMPLRRVPFAIAQ